ncbi:MAG TPA: glycoside hydrolase family 3 C-terminal domain-containing protein, partial [Edaphobacter sp.]|nr:glycoside hydrolase family 3 C-terminal domain-containing protein [Edaphobacter sp.]
LHGVARGGEATMFPQAIGMAATWDRELLRAEGNVIGIEGRARYNQAQREGNTGQYFGLTFWSPNINIFRDPRWGRGQETLGEDPYLTGALGTEFVLGVQGTDAKYLQAIATPKHYAVHSGPESLRHGFNVTPSAKDLFETYLPAFRKTIVEGKADSLMCAYNAINGEPACANTMLLKDVLRGDWGFKGFVTSDCGAIHDITAGHHFGADNAHGSALAVKAGTDLTCGGEYVDLVKSVNQGLIPESEIDTALSRLFTARMRLGMFDPPNSVPFSKIPISENHSQEHQDLSLRAALESIVLLKNDGTLPLKDRRTIAVIGPGATSLLALEGNYKGTPTHPILPLDGMESVFGTERILFAQGAPFAGEVAVPVPRSAFSSRLSAEFYNGTHFEGLPVVTRVDKQIDFDWNAVAPAPGVDPYQFSVRWTGTFRAPGPGDYTFQIDDPQCEPSNDHETYMVRIEGSEEFHLSSTCRSWRRSKNSFTVHFADSQPHRFTVEFTNESHRFSAGITFSWKAPEQVLLKEALDTAGKADAVVVFAGLNAGLEGEEMPLHVPGFQGGDRTDITLPAVQNRLIDALAELKKPLILVLQTGSAVALSPNGQAANAIVEAWYPGELGGRAIAETLSGQNNPSGRLPLTFYSAVAQLPAFDDYSMKNRTYRYFAGKPAYPFGFGLSYTSFAYAHLKLDKRIKASSPQHISVQIRNKGTVPGDEVVQAYLSYPGRPSAPIRALKSFQRVHLNPGEEKQVDVVLDSRDLALVDESGRTKVDSGDYDLWVGGGQPGSGAPGVSGHFSITGVFSLPR